MDRREFMLNLAKEAVLTGFSVGALLSFGCLRRAVNKPNSVVLLCDDLGCGDLACYGHPVIMKPSLDRLAEEGTKPTDCYAAAPVCSPSRAGMLTGRTPNRRDIYDWILTGSLSAKG